jgi:DNA-binding transcriptional MerR regulator
MFDLMQSYSLSDLEKLTGIKSDTIRIWESRYGILKPQYTPTRRRFYSDSDLVHLLNVSLLYRHGSKISVIASFSRDEVAGKAAQLEAGSFEPDSFMDRLLIATLHLDEEKVNEVLLDSVISIGFEDTFKSVVFPFLYRVGVMWHTGLVNSGTEHFISHIFRNRLIQAADSISKPEKASARRVLMYLPENEFHELAILYYRYIIRKRGHRILYLGQSTPMGSVIEVARQWNPDLIITGIISGVAYPEPHEYIRELGSSLKGITILAAGMLAEAATGARVRNVKPLRNESDLSRHLR